MSGTSDVYVTNGDHFVFTLLSYYFQHGTVKIHKTRVIIGNLRGHVLFSSGILVKNIIWRIFDETSIFYCFILLTIQVTLFIYFLRRRLRRPEPFRQTYSLRFFSRSVSLQFQYVCSNSESLAKFCST